MYYFCPSSAHLRGIVIPDLDHPLGRTGEEDAGDERVPGDVVDRSVVGRVRLQKSRSII